MRYRRSKARLRECRRLAQRLANLPCNRDGADKTWVVETLEGIDRLLAQARLLPARSSRAGVR